MQNADITKEMLRSLALANGVTIPEERLDAVLKQYEEYLKTLEKLDSLPLSREAEPEIIYSLRDAERKRDSAQPQNAERKRDSAQPQKK